MNKINAKAYYEKSTGNVLVVTTECEGYNVLNTTIEQDVKIYSQLQNKTIDEIDFIELEYGTLISTFNNVKSYKVNLKTNILECIYYTQEELELQNNKLEESKSIQDRINTILSYMNLDNASILDLEEFILQREKNKIVGGVK